MNELRQNTLSPVTVDVDLNDNGVTAVGESSRTQSNKPSASTATPKKPTVTKKSFTFDLDECRKSGDTITCEVMITNNDKDQRRLRFGYDSFGSRPSTIIDDHGTEHKASRTTLGDKSLYEYAILNSGVPLRGSVVFEGMEEPKSIKLLTLSFHAPPTDSRVYSTPASTYFEVQFRDVSIAP